MLEIVLNNVSKSYGNKIVLKNINFEVKTNDKIAIIGQNGCGKTTILKMIVKEENNSSGNIFINKNKKIGYLSQTPNESFSNCTINEVLYSSFKEINDIKKKMEKEELIMSRTDGKDLEKSIIRFSDLQEKFINMGGYEISSKIEKIVSAFKISSKLNNSYNNLSGGEKTVVNLIYILLSNPDILLLDEPTNHLDISMIEWLEKYLINCNKTVIIVSHDRFFLDKVIKKIILIDNGEEEIFTGNYTEYVKENEARVMREFENYKNQQKQIAAMKESIKKLKEYGKLAYPCGEKFFKRAASIEKRLEKIEPVNNPKKQNTLNINFDFEKRSGNNVIELSNFYYSINDKLLFEKCNLLIKYKEKICILGPNGSGKTSLIKQIINKNCNIKLGTNIKIGYIPQEIKFQDENITVYEEARKSFIGTEENLRAALVKFLFYSEGIFIKLCKLSGGERIRLKLFCLMQEENNLLILDEPTNHIDINTKEILEEALINYNGTVIAVSHDRYFINKIATRIIIIDNKKLKSIPGNYDYYKKI